MKLYAYGAAVAAIVIGGWYYGHTRYNAGQDDIRAGVAEQVAAATAETARIEAERVKLSERIEDELQPKLAAADASARDTARKLRIATSSCPLPKAAGTAADPSASPGEPGDAEAIGQATERFFAAAARDAERLAAWQEWYRGLQDGTQESGPRRIGAGVDGPTSASP